MSKNKPTKNASLTTEEKTADALHSEWVAALEESAVAHKELRAARAGQRDALEQWEKAQEHDTLTPDSRQKVDRRLLRTIKLERKVREEARVARDAEAKAWEATGLPAARRPLQVDEDEAPTLRADTSAVSPVIGVILMVAITVLLAAVVFFLVSDIGGTQEVPPAMSFREEDGTLTVLSADEDLTWSDFTVTGCTTVPTGAVDAGDRIEDCSGRVTIKHDPSNSLVYDAEL